MSFAVTEFWNVNKKSAFRIFFDAVSETFASDLIPTQYSKNVRRTISGALTVILHIGVLFFMIFSVFDGVSLSDTVGNGAKNQGLSVFDLQDDPAASDSDSGEVLTKNPADKIAEQQVKNQTELDTSIQTVSEWSVSSMQVSVRRPRSVESSNNIANQGIVGSESSGDSGVYDPFAGAAPNRKDKKRSGAATAILEDIVDFVSGSDLERRLFEDWLAQLRTRLPRSHGDVMLAVKVSGDGKVTSARLLGGSASPQVKFFIRNAILGERLFKSDLSWGGTEQNLPRILLR